VWLCVVVGFLANKVQPVSLKMQRNEVDEMAFARDMVGLRRPLRLRGRWKRPKDGLYRVVTRRGRWPSRCGGFLVYKGRVRRCSPSIKRRIHIYAHQAEWVCLPWA
jgi:hypothetical protein